MGETTHIAWCDSTFNPWIGCQKVSDLCKNCYAEVSTFTRAQRSRGLELWGPDAQRHRTSDANWRQPFLWNEEAKRAGVRRRVFCASLSDVFEDRRDLDAWRSDLWRLIDDTPNLDWLLLTKRPQNVRRLAPLLMLQSTWVGYSGVDADGIEALMRIPSRVRFLSLEPLLGPFDLAPHIPIPIVCRRGSTKSMATRDAAALREMARALLRMEGFYPIDWVIVGGESGHHARALDLAWIRDILRVCRATSTPAFVKQLGAKPFNGPHRVLLEHTKGGDMTEWDEDLRVQEFPA